MKCYNHSAVDAVSVCKSCCRALCHDCVAEVGLSCSCRDRCEEDVQALNDLLERGRTAYQTSSAAYAGSGGMAAIIGILAILFAIYGLVTEGKRELSLFLFVVGAAFAVYGVLYFHWSRAFGKVNGKR